MTKQYRNSSAGRLGGQFPKRLAQGKLIDRSKARRGGKTVEIVEAPSGLLKFFQHISERM
jgi:hypothetical protein